MPGSAQSRATVTVEDYQRAEKFMNYNTTPLVSNGPVRATWLPGDRFWYRNHQRQRQRVLARRCRERHESAGVQSRRGGRGVDDGDGQAGRPPAQLPFTQITFAADGLVVLVRQRQQTLDLRCAGQAVHLGRSAGAGAEQRAVARRKVTPPTSRTTTSGSATLATGADKQLTTDGVKDYGYATDNAGWISSDRPVLKWSPDSKKIATFQQDQRKAGEMYLVNTTAGHPTLRAWKYPLPGDENITMIERVVIEVDAAEGDSPQDGPGPASLDALRRRQVRWRMGRRAVEPGRQPGLVRLDVTQSPAGEPARRRCRHRRDSRGPRGKGRDVPRIRQRPRQLEVLARIE